MLSSRSRPTTRSTSAGGTARTTWWGQLSIATAAPSAPTARQIASTRSRSAATATRRASGRSPDDSKPRKIAPSRPSFCSSTRSAGKTPAAARASSSPLLWPTTASGRSPSRVRS